MRIIFVSSLDINEIHIMHTKSDNIELMSGTETNDVINELFKSFLRRYQEGLETKIKGEVASYIKATKNPKNTRDNECFKYAITAALNLSRINNHPEKISKLRSFIDNYNWKDIGFPSNSKNYKKFEQNNKTIALNIVYVQYNTTQIRQAYISKYNSKRDNQVILLMITDVEK